MLDRLLQVQKGRPLIHQMPRENSGKEGRSPPRGKLTKATQHVKDTALKSSKVVEFCPSPKSGGGTPTPSEEDPGPAESNLKDDPLVSGLIKPVTLPLELLIPSSERRVKLRALLDMGCIK